MAHLQSSSAVPFGDYPTAEAFLSDETKRVLDFLRPLTIMDHNAGQPREHQPVLYLQTVPRSARNELCLLSSCREPIRLSGYRIAMVPGMYRPHTAAELPRKPSEFF